MKSIAPKIIWRIVATISLAVVLFFSLPSFWFWVSFETIAVVLVAVGCAGEWWLHHRPTGRKKVEKESHHKFESRFIGAVSLGVAMEVFALGHSIHEGVKLDNKVSQTELKLEEIRGENAQLVAIGERAKESSAMAIMAAEEAKKEREIAEKGRLELEKQVLELIEKTKPRTINKDTKADLAKTFLSVEKSDIEIVAYDKDAEGVSLGHSLKNALSEAGYLVTLNRVPFLDFTIINPKNPKSGPVFSDLVFIVNDENRPPPFAIRILLCLRAHGFAADGWLYNKTFRADSLQILVCPKPVTEYIIGFILYLQGVCRGFVKDRVPARRVIYFGDLSKSHLVKILPPPHENHPLKPSFSRPKAQSLHLD